MRLMHEMMADRKEIINYSSALKNMKLTSEIIPLLVEGIEEADEFDKLMLKRLADELPLEVKLENREALQNVFSMEEWSFITELDESSEEKLELWLENHLLKLEVGEQFDQTLLERARAIARRQVDEGWVDTEALRAIIERQKNESYVPLETIIVIYKIGLIKEDSLIEDIAPMLLLEDDLLLEELKNTLVAFQSDRVVEAVEPLVTGTFPIFQVDAIGGTHTPSAVAALKRIYEASDDIDLKSVAVNGLAEQLAAEGRPEIEDFMTYDFYDGVYDMEELAYGYFKVMDYDHPELENWREKALYRIENAGDPSDILSHMESIMPSPKKPAVSEKIGRNEPCPCGSGKKYKECHGK